MRREILVQMSKQRGSFGKQNLYGFNWQDAHVRVACYGYDLMGWMHFLNSDNIVAVPDAILPFQDANAPCSNGLCSLFGLKTK